MKKDFSIFGRIGIFIVLNSSVRVRQSSHTSHDSEHVVIHSVHTELATVGSNTRPQGEQERGVINSRHVDRAAWLVLFRVECKGVYIDTGCRDSGVVLVWLYQVKVVTTSDAESVMTIELELGINNSLGNCCETRVTTSGNTIH